eukprot:12071630-Ditylum_brightwellii.AAC.1
MRPITKGVAGGKISTLDVPGDPVTCLSIYSEVAQQLDLQPTLLRQNSLHLHQSFDTAFADGALKKYIGNLG